MLYKVSNGRVSIHGACVFQLGGAWLVDGGGEAEVLRSSRITAGVGGHATAQIKGINKRLV